MTQPADGQTCENCGEDGHLVCGFFACQFCGEPGAGGHECDDAPYCQNCDGRKCMDCVTRTVHDACADDCPHCCPRDPCTTCEGMGAVEFPELLPCPECDPAQYLAELVLCGLPTDTDDARAAATRICPPPVTTEASAVLHELMEKFGRAGDPW